MFRRGLMSANKRVNFLMLFALIKQVATVSAKTAKRVIETEEQALRVGINQQQPDGKSTHQRRREDESRPLFKDLSSLPSSICYNLRRSKFISGKWNAFRLNDKVEVAVSSVNRL